jgi:hypothetical protein
MITTSETKIPKAAKREDVKPASEKIANLNIPDPME